MRLSTQSKWLFLKGLAMGAADLVPGISGGTIALITGIYEELLYSLKSLNLQAIKKLFTKGINECWHHINGYFLLPLGTGILVSVFCFSSFIHYLLTTFPVFLWSFFFGLITISFFSMIRKTRHITLPYLIALAIGTLLAWGVTSAAPVTIESPSLLTFFAAGALAICAMILPGLSGSFILLLLGLYSPVLQAVMHLNWPVITLFSLGCVCGLLCFSHLLNWLLKRFHVPMFGLLSGLMLGALNKVWPWKKTLTMAQGDTLHVNIAPWTYAGMTSILHLCLAMSCMLAGILLFVFLEKGFKMPKKM